MNEVFGTQLETVLAVSSCPAFGPNVMSAQVPLLAPSVPQQFTYQCIGPAPVLRSP